MFLKDISLAFIIIPFFIGGIFYSRIARHKTGNKLRDSIKNLQIMIIMTAILCMLMLFLMPSTAVLGSFNYPDDITDINTQEKLLGLLQDYNLAITRTTEVVYYLLFILIFWIITSVYQLLQLYRNRLDEQIEAKYNEETL